MGSVLVMCQGCGAALLLQVSGGQRLPQCHAARGCPLCAETRRLKQPLPVRFSSLSRSVREQRDRSVMFLDVPSLEDDYGEESWP